MTIYLALGLAAAITGMFIGRTVIAVARRRAANPEQAAHRQHAVLLAFAVIVGSLLIFDAIDSKRHRYLNLTVVAIMVGGVAFDWFRARRHRSTS